MITRATVYRIEHPDRCGVYIGKTINLMKRRSQHRRAAAHGTSPLYEWWRTLPSEPVFAIVAEGVFSDRDEADRWAFSVEVATIAGLGAAGVALLNSDSGGRGGRRPTAGLRAKLRASHRRRVAAATPEQRRAWARKGIESKAPEQRSEAARKGVLSRPIEDRRAVMRKVNASRTPESRSAAAFKANDTRGPDGRSEAVRKGNARLTLEQRRERSRAARARQSAEDRSDATRRGWVTRRANQSGSQ